jgi:hypothetical protein
MNFVGALLLSYLPEAEAFGALVVLMQDRGLRRYYSTDMALLQVGRGRQGAVRLVGWGCSMLALDCLGCGVSRLWF